MRTNQPTSTIQSRLSTLGILFVSSIFGIIAINAQAKVTETISKTIALKSTGSIYLENINGDVEITTCQCDQVSLDAHINASDDSHKERVNIDIQADTNTLKIKTQYQKNQHHHSGYVEVNYQLKVPQNVNLADIELVNGNLAIKGVKGKLFADMVNGNLIANDLGNTTQVKMVNGNIKIYVADTSKIQSIQLNSVNGDIDLYLPKTSGMLLKASTVSGSLDNDFDIEIIKNRYIGEKMRGTTGDASMAVNLENVNGHISVHQN
ncbi:DUF4097 family beta strand repeat-containing protein [Aliikangiella maris]|uniref:DUF4097 family beta strand repeat-containing protein n=2 Tax=Aliikangiella maris TaxID=3162458 RepID=A0ABV2BT07_9GAMM